ncbi:MAG: hypothetical protein ACFCUG_00970 [Thiotrichales bacterium]
MKLVNPARGCRTVLLGFALIMSPLALAEPVTDTATDTVVEAGHLDGLAAALKQYGWRVERDAEGALLLFPRGGEAAGGAAEGASVADAAAPDGRDETVPVGSLDQLGRALTTRGWKTERSADGDLLVFPVGTTSPGASAASGVASDSSAIAIDASDLDTLQAVAAERGWGHRRESDGSLVLIPPGQAVSDPADVGCQSGMRRVGGDAALSGPIDTWHKARHVAELWIAAGGDPSVSKVGKIRQVNDLYLVSLLDPKSPYRLRAQLVIRVKDGCTMEIPR